MRFVFILYEGIIQYTTLDMLAVQLHVFWMDDCVGVSLFHSKKN